MAARAQAAAPVDRDTAAEDDEAWRSHVPPPPPAAASRRRQEDKADRSAARDWILQYADDASASSDSGSEGGGEVDDWEVWSDPREVERRRAERRRAALPPDVRRAKVAEEWAANKGAAVRAKAAGDKGRQRELGDQLRQLRAEMAQLGMTEDEINNIVSAPDRPGSAAAGAAVPPEGDSQAVPQDAVLAGLHDGAQAGGLAAEGSPPADNGALGSESAARAAAPALELSSEPARADATEHLAPVALAAATAEPAEPASVEQPHKEAVAASNGAVLEDEEEEGGLGLFDEEGDGADWAAPQAATAVPAASPIAPWGQAAAARAPAVSKKGKAKGRELPPVETKQAKALLQQWCQRAGRPMPRYEKLTPGGGRMESAGLRYEVTIEAPARPSGPRKGKAAAAARPAAVRLREAEDGWASISEAQNAVATRALFQLAGEEAPWQQLEEPWRALWQAWAAQAAAAPPITGAPAADAEGRAEFVRSLVAVEAPAAPSVAPAAAAADVPSSSQAAPRAPHQQPSARQEADSRDMAAALAAWRASSAGREWQQRRAALPVAQIKDELLAALAKNDVVVVSGDTGSGKTTQVPQYLLEAAAEAGQGGACSIVCTQPRRIAAVSVAERVAEERGEPPPGVGGSRVGYQVRLDSAVTPATRLAFCTTGILLRRLAGDPTLAAVSHVIVDEVHERTIQGDFLMALLRTLLDTRRAMGRPFKVVLMSATLDPGLFSRYFGGCPVVAAGGRTFPVTHLFLEDCYQQTGYRLDPDARAALRPHSQGALRRQHQRAAGSRAKQGLLQGGWGDDEAGEVLNPHYDAAGLEGYAATVRANLGRLNEDAIDLDLLEELVDHIHTSKGEGAVLVFLPGMGEIAALRERLCARRSFRGEASDWVLPLHSSISPQEQKRVFRAPPPGLRKVVIATNIAETSLTIADVVYVIESGKLKERRHDPLRGLSLLVEDWVSKASALQRKGRAGRVRAGVCFCLYTRQRFESRMRPFQAPEIVRLPLEELVLQIHLLRLGAAAAFLQRVIQPPPARSIEGAVSNLQQIGALTEDEQLTPLGHHLAQLPMDARLGKLLLLAAALGCLAPALTIAACLSHKSPFLSKLEEPASLQKTLAALSAAGAGTLLAGQQSDHLLMVAAYDAWASKRQKGGVREAAAFARQQSLSHETLEMLLDMRAQFASMLADSRFIALGPGHARGPGPNNRSPAATRQAAFDDPSQAWNAYAAHPSVVKAVLLAALYPNVAVMDESSGAAGGSLRRPSWHDGMGTVEIHPTSVNHALTASQFRRPYIMYLEKVRTSRTYMRDTTVVSPLAILLFGGRLEVAHEAGYIHVDGWLKIRAAASVAVQLKQLRMGLDSLLAEKVRNPARDVQALQGGQLIAAIAKLLDDEERESL